MYIYSNYVSQNSYEYSLIHQDCKSGRRAPFCNGRSGPDQGRKQALLLQLLLLKLDHNCRNRTSIGEVVEPNEVEAAVVPSSLSNWSTKKMR